MDNDNTNPSPTTRQDGSAASRRALLKLASASVAAAGASAAIGGGAAAAARHQATTATAVSSGDPLTRRIPRSPSGERVPVIGLGSFMTFDRAGTADRSFIPAVIQEFYNGGGRVLDTSALYGASEVNVGEALDELGLTNALFLTNKSWNCGDYFNDPSHALRQFDQSQQRLRRPVMDVVGVHSMTNVGMMLPILRNLKAQGHIRYIGLTSHEPYQYAGMEPLIAAGAVDFIQIRYSIFERAAEEGLLKLAADNGVAVMVNMPLEKGRLHRLVEGRPLPGHARELEVSSWAEYFLKYVIAHRAVTSVVPATTVPAHAAENVRAMRGPLPDRDLRRRMVAHMTKVPGFTQLASMPWYPGKSFPGALVRLPDPRPAG